ncbi:MAG: HAD family hydrolase [Selenomonadaceae bacterium]
MKQIYKAVVFDLDGTLINTIYDLADSGNELLASFGKAPHTVDEYRYFVGNGSRKLVERILPEFTPAEVDAALEKYKGIYARRLFNKTKVYDGILELLDALTEMHIMKAVCTNKHMSAAESIIGHFFKEGTFDAYVGDRAGYPRKPDPANVFYVLDKMGAKPEETVYLGDSSVDMETAVRAGALPVGVLWGFREKDELVENGAKILIEKPMDLLEKVDFR